MAPTIHSFQVSATPFVILAQILAIGMTTLLLFSMILVSFSFILKQVSEHAQSLIMLRI